MPVSPALTHRKPHNPDPPTCTRTASATARTHSGATPRDTQTHAAHARSDARPPTHGESLVHSRPGLPRTPSPAVPRRVADARAGTRTPSARLWVTAPPPGPRPFPGPVLPGPGPRPLTGARAARLPAGGAARGPVGGRPERRVPHESAAPRPHARPFGSAAACAGPRALPPLPTAGPRRPLRSCALPPRWPGGRPAATAWRPHPSARRSPSDRE